MDTAAIENGVDGSDPISSMIAGIDPAGPRLPQELLDHIIEQLHDDRSALRQCCLASSILRTTAQPLLFREVEIILARDPDDPTIRRAHLCFPHRQEPRNLERLIECYSSLPLAQHARVLLIRGSEHQALSVNIFPSLQSVITLLSSCQQNIPDVIVSAMPTSRISSLSIHCLFGPAAVFARILYAFPRLEVLRLTHIRFDSSSPAEMSAIANSSSLPALRILELGRAYQLWALMSALFPDGIDVRLRSFSGDEESVEQAWNTVFARAGRHLETLTLTNRGMPGAVVFDLTTNTRLKRLTLISSGAENESFPGLALSTLRSITSHLLEEVTLQWQWSERNNPRGDRTACLALDEELVRLSRGLRRVTIKYEVLNEPPAEEFFEKAFSQCFALGILHIQYVMHHGYPRKRLAARF